MEVPPRPGVPVMSKVYAAWLDSLPWTEITARQRAGESVKALAAELGINRATLARRIASDDPIRRGPPSIQLPVSDDDLRARHAAGTTVTELARTYQVSRATIWRHLTVQPLNTTPATTTNPRAGRSVRATARTRDYRAWLNGLPWPELAQRYQAGETIISMANSLDIPTATLYKRLRQHTTMRPTRQPADISASPAELDAAHRAGVNATRLAQAFGGTATSVTRRIRLHRQAQASENASE
ncbi:transposase-like protein [Friedmanniella endophytica]|uniref:Transposase-like protein n=1 Tax=Microlunatus kandeliicorticis TaxID=1759536 RepID=A0A7W3IRR7_9ACTN|nr:helix-turn-helix domain-containing protein [Microlunatus kandeliicorticis]MBA8794063.1 transposase-like protein [Microlunatus kandeliicorticis]